MSKFPILKSNSLDANDESVSKKTISDKPNVISKILGDKEFCKSVDHLFTRSGASNEPSNVSVKTRFSEKSVQRNRNSRSEENLVDIVDTAECFGFNFKTKSISFESDNEFNKVNRKVRSSGFVFTSLKNTELLSFIFFIV